MANNVIASVNKTQSTGNKDIYEVILQTQTINVTVTHNSNVAAEWVQMMEVEHQSFFPLGVAVHNDEGGQPTCNVLTLCTGLECLVVQLYRGSLPRDVLVFLRDVCTCYGWRTDEYNNHLVARNPRLSLGRLTDIQTLVPNGSYMGLGDFSLMYLGHSVPEPVVSSWTRSLSLKKSQIRETVVEAYICQVIGRMYPNAAPPNHSLNRVISYTYPQINLTNTTAGKIMYQVSISANHTLRVTYTTRAAVLVAWLSSLGRRETQPELIGIDVNHDHRGRDTVVALASGDECMLLNLRQANYGSLVSEDVFGFLDSSCPFVGWNTKGIANLGLGLSPERVFNIRDEFPATHSYEDLAIIALGYEMAPLITFGRDPEEGEIMREAVQAYVCLMGGMNLGYQNRHW